jgi:hypothetical protein
MRIHHAVFSVSLALVAAAGCSRQPTTSTAKVEAPAAAATPANELAPGRQDSAVASTKPTDRSKIPLAQRPPVVNPIRAARTVEELANVPLYQFNEADLDAYLKHLHATEPDPIKRLVHLARKNIGQPYDIYLLGEFPYETHDPDPMYCLTKSDCVTNVEHMYAEALSDGWPKFFQTLQRLRYKNGQVGMVTRNHETVADWNANNAWLFDDVTDLVAGSPANTAPLRMTWRPAKFFAKFGLGQGMPDVRIEQTYIPSAKIPSILPNLKQGDVINIVRGNPATEQWVGHVGLIVTAPDGSPNFLHSAEPTVREQPLTDYVAKTPKSTIGIKVLRPKPNPQQLADAASK